VNIFRNKAVIIHGAKMVFTTKRVKMVTAEELAEQEQLYQVQKEQAKLNKAGNARGLSEGSRSGAGNKASGKFTQGVRRAMQKCIDIFFMRAPEAGGINPATGKTEVLKAAMHSLTIPGGEKRYTAAEFKKLFLHPYLKTLNEQHGVEAYVYGCEFQTEGENAGQIHVHIFVDRYIPVKECSQRWVDILETQEIASRYREKFGKDPHQACDVKGIKSDRRLQWYLQKYLVKCRQKEGYTVGHWWGASAWIKKAKLPTFEPSEQTERKVYSHRGSPEFYFTDVYIDKDTKEMLFNEAGAFTPGAKKMMTIVRGNYNKEKKQRADVRDLLAADDRKLYEAFVKAYRRCDWEWTEMAATDLPQLMRQEKGPVDYSFIYKQVKERAEIDRLSAETQHMRYIRLQEEKPKLKKKPPSPGQELPL
jgi:hypothetical protein